MYYEIIHYVNDNEMWVVGGLSTNYPLYSHIHRGYESPQTTEIFDRKTKSFRKGPNVPVYMVHHCMTKLNASHVFIGGIFSPDYNDFDTSFLVDIREEPFVFHMLPKMDESRMSAGCGVIRSD